MPSGPRPTPAAFARRSLAPLALALLAAVAPAARAQSPVPADSGRFIVFDGDMPVAHENFVFQDMGDSLVVTAHASRVFQDEHGARHEFSKSMMLVADATDLGLVRYLSNQDFAGSHAVRGLLPGDTAMSYYSEADGVGGASRVVQPPGRLFVLDSQLFTLFDVLCRSLAAKQFDTRRVQVVALTPDTLTMPLATVTQARPDTLRLGGRRVVARHYTFEDPSVRFELWADARGHMLRLRHEPSGLSVELAPPPAPSPARRRAPPKR